MLNHEGFDLWADGYDRSVTLADEAEEYPFAGYRKVLNTIYNIIKCRDTATVLDIGFGTGVLAKKLYDENYSVYGIDFSEKMIGIAKTKMPDAVLLQHDFSKGLHPEWKETKFDFITCTYAIHHLTDSRKLSFLSELKKHLAENWKILIGDVAFQTREQLEACRKQNEEIWDNEEQYPVFSELAAVFRGADFFKMSFCAGVITIGGGPS